MSLRGIGRFALVVAFVALSILPTYADEGRRDGNWWRSVGVPKQLGYMTGFFDGMRLGHRFSFWNLKGPDGMLDGTIVSRVTDSFAEYSKLMNNITNGQFVDGLSKFYDDYRNRRIMIPDAVWIVAQSIDGKADKEMEVLIENFRKNPALDQ